MSDADMLAQDAVLYAEVPDALGISYTVTELFHGSIAACLAKAASCPAAAREAMIVESADGMVRARVSELEAALDRAAP